MRFILRTMLVALVAFEGCKDTKKEEKTPANPSGAVTDPNTDPKGGQGGKQQPLVPENKSGKKKTPILPKKPSKQAEVKIKVKAGDAGDAAEKEITIKGLFYEKGKSGDFETMIGKDDYKKTLFVFNDYAEDFDAFVALTKPEDRKPEVAGCTAGKGNAIIRPFQCSMNPQGAAGVPIGPKAGEGYKALDEATKKKIADAITAIRKLVSENDFDTVVFTQSSDVAGMISTGKVEVNDDVKKFIYDSLLTLEAKTA